MAIQFVHFLALPETTAHQVQGPSYFLLTRVTLLPVVLFGNDPIISEKDEIIVMEPLWAFVPT